MKKVPYGIIDYKKLREKDCVYVDKTMYLGVLENVGDTLIYLRPGRFGKSLFTSMMFNYYDINSKDLFETLFKDTYVYKNPTPYKNKYYVLNFDFSGISTSNEENEDISETFKDCIITGIYNFLSAYRLEYEVDTTKNPASIIKYFLSFFKGLNLEAKIYILIDEYDNFTNGILKGDGHQFTEIVGDTGFVKTFYATIKEYVKYGVVDRVFITGICPITMDSMTTGFNIATDISLKPEFDSMIGLTHEDVLNLMSDIEETKRKELFELMLKNYDGYLFSRDTDTRVFNATLVMYFLDNYITYGKIPRDLIDKNIVVNYGKIENLVKLQNNEFYKEIIDTLLTSEEISGELKTSFNLKLDFTRSDIISLLYYFGYLTIKKEEYGSITFKIPNFIMKETYHYYFLKLLSEENIKIDDNKRLECIKEIVEEKRINKLSNYVSEILHLIDNRNFMNFNERNIQNIYFATLLGNSEIEIRDEYPCNNGYVDLMIEPKRNKDYRIMVELKYIKKKEFTKKLLEEKYAEAINQLKSYELDERIDNSSLKKYVVIFVGSECKLIEEV